MTEQEILSQLNPSQREAVEYCDGPQLVIAGAGSGKTRVLTYKIAYLLTQGLQPWNVLALTFTNKAAREMKERIGQLVGMETARLLNMGTFHSVFSRILRTEAEAIGYTSNFTIYDQADSRQLVKNIISEMGLDDKKYKPADVAGRISMAKNHVILPSAYPLSGLGREDFQRQLADIGTVYVRYAERLRQSNAMDFDDLLLRTFLLFEENEELRRKWVNRFHYVLVDEYQDTNTVQQKIVHQLTRERQRVCVVGDDAQSIYSFRGANIDNILDFCELYAGARQYKLEQNYRSTQLIVEAANSLISRNQRQIRKNVFSKNEVGDRVQVRMAYSDKEEAMLVCKEIARLRQEDGGSYSDFAILYRTNAQSRTFEEEMRKTEMPYRIYGGLSFYQRKEIKDAIAYFRLVANPDDEEALRRVINYPTRGIGATTVGKIASAAASHGVSLWEVMEEPAAHGLALGKAAQGKVDAFREMVDAWRARLGTADAYSLGVDIIKQSGMSKDIYTGRDADQLARQENVDELMAGLREFVDGGKEADGGQHVQLTDFLQEVSLMTDLDSEGEEDAPRVTLMTIHCAKGLEFPNVFVVGVEENIFPSPMAGDNPRAIEEERRLLYVAITRAERRCYITCAENRYRYGRMEFDTPSRFIKDINPKLLCVKGGSGDIFGEGGGQGYRGRASRWEQNPHPVATQFRADPRPREVAPRRDEQGVNPFSPSFERKLQAAGVRTLKPVRATVASRSAMGVGMSQGVGGIVVGARVEHQRFGRGQVVAVEGVADSAKATIAFENAGTKQLLLKFAKLRVIG